MLAVVETRAPAGAVVKASAPAVAVVSTFYGLTVARSGRDLSCANLVNLEGISTGEPRRAKVETFDGRTA